MKTTNASTALALILGLGLGVAALPVAAEQHMAEEKPMVCDTNDDGIVSAAEADVCAEEEFGEFTDEDYLTEEQFGTMYQGTGEPGDAFAQIDEDGDGQISRDEWVSWREHGFAEAAEGSDGIPASDFDSWRSGDITAPERPQERSPSGGPSDAGGTGGTGGTGSAGGSGSTD